MDLKIEDLVGAIKDNGLNYLGHIVREPNFYLRSQKRRGDIGALVFEGVVSEKGHLTELYLASARLLDFAYPPRPVSIPEGFIVEGLGEETRYKIPVNSLGELKEKVEAMQRLISPVIESHRQFGEMVQAGLYHGLIRRRPDGIFVLNDR